MRREENRFEMSKEWCLRMAELEGDHEVGAGFSMFDAVVAKAIKPDK